MNIIKVTKLVKRRTKNMLAELMPEYNYVRIRNSGLIVLKENWWSCKRIIVNITDLYIDIFPKELAENCKRKGYGDTYERIFSNDIYIMLQLKSYKKDVNIADYMWNKFNTLYREVPIFNITTNVVILENSENRYIPILSPVSSRYIPGIERLLKRMKKRDSVENLVEKISKIKLRVPQILIRNVNLQFAY